VQRARRARNLAADALQPKDEIIIYFALITSVFAKQTQNFHSDSMAGLPLMPIPTRPAQGAML
jgi:hypothetical protein